MLKPLKITLKENPAGRSEKAAKNGVLDLVKNSRQKHLTDKNNKLTAFSRLLQDNLRSSRKQSVTATSTLQNTLEAVRKNLQKTAGAELSKADLEKITDKLLNQKIVEQLKKLLKDSGLTEEQQVSQLNSLLEKLRSKDKSDNKLTKNDILSVLSQIGEFLAAGLQQAKKGMNQPREKQEAELAGIPGKDNSRKEGNEPRIVVIDLRRQEQGTKVKNSVNDAKQRSASFKIQEKSGTDADPLGKEVKFYTSQGAGSRETGSAENGKVFQNTLNRYQGLSTTDLQRMNELLKNEIVKNTGIVLKTNNNGEIRLILKPETLGKVKINLNLENNRIDGKILVENNIVREMIENSLQGLNHALMDEGFDAVTLHVSVNDGNKDSKEKTAEETAAGSRKKRGTDVFGKNIPLAAEYSQDYGLVNLVI